MDRQGGSSTAKGTARDAGWTALATLLGTALRLLAALAATHILGAAAFGTYTLARSVALVAGMAASVGLSPGVLPFVARARRQDDLAALRALVRSSWLITGGVASLLAAALFLAAPWLAERAFDDPELTSVLEALSPFVLLLALLTVNLAVVQGLMRIKAQAWIERVVVLAVTVLVLALTWVAGWGMTGVVAATLAGPLVGLALAIRLVRKLVPGVFAVGVETSSWPTRELAAESWPLMGSRLFTLAIVWMDVILMGVFRSPEEVGVYGLCARLAPLVILVHESIAPSFAARLSALHSEGDWDGIGKLYRLTGRWSLWSGLVLGGVLILAGPPLLALFGPEFATGVSVLVVLTVGRMFMAAGGLSARMLVLTGKGRLNLVNTGALLACNLVLDILWIPEHGGWGAAWATAIAILLGKALQVGQVAVIYRLVPWTSRSLVALVATGAMFAVCWPWRAGPGVVAGWLLPLVVFVAGSAVVFARFGMADEDREVVAAARRRIGGGR